VIGYAPSLRRFCDNATDANDTLFERTHYAHHQRFSHPRGRGHGYCHNLNDASVQIVDIRDIRELADGTLVGAYHAPRGMLEFWVDPDSPYHKPLFADESREFILFCGAGWRSALAAKALQDMGMTNVAHMDGGYAEWVKQGAPTESLEAQKARRSTKG
jgi:rhodanese-related sulfurtransferase